MRPREKKAAAGLLFFVLLAASLAGLRAQDGDPAEELREKEEDRIGRLFEKVVPTLDKARKLVDRHDSLPKRRFLLLRPLGGDQFSNEAETRELLGAHIIGTHATELISLGQMALSFRVQLDYFVDTIFNYPTFAEGFRIAALNGLNKLPDYDA